MFPHNKSHFNTKITNDIYSINGKWSEFFSTLTADDKELEEYLQVVFSMCLIGEVSKEGLTIIKKKGLQFTLKNLTKSLYIKYSTWRTELEDR
jgi:hypothetical protein